MPAQTLIKTLPLAPEPGSLPYNPRQPLPADYPHPAMRPVEVPPPPARPLPKGDPLPLPDFLSGKVVDEDRELFAKWKKAQEAIVNANDGLKALEQSAESLKAKLRQAEVDGDDVSEPLAELMAVEARLSAGGLLAKLTHAKNEAVRAMWLVKYFRSEHLRELIEAHEPHANENHKAMTKALAESRKKLQPLEAEHTALVQSLEHLAGEADGRYDGSHFPRGFDEKPYPNLSPQAV